MFGQTFDVHDLAVVGLLVVLEGVLSIDNALVLGLLAKRLPKHQQRRGLTYGLVGAFAFRLVAIAAAVWLMTWWFVKLIGGGYLVYIAVKHLFFEGGDEAGASGAGATDSADVATQAVDSATSLETVVGVPDCGMPGAPPTACAKFWPTVVVIELTDIAFAIDSILAAIALVGSPPSDAHGLHPKFWVIVTGGMLGVILMRVAAILFIKMLERFPRFETAAYLLVALIGVKLLVDWWFNKPPPGFPPTEVYRGPVDFHSPAHPAFWVFWGGMLVCFCVGFIPPRKRATAGAA
jgi:YkoY family integral membrane protein